MKQSKKTLAAMLFVSTMLGAIGQIFFKIGVTGGFAVLVEYVAAGFAAYIISTAIYFYVLSRTHLSWAYSFGGLSYIFASVLAFLFLSEQVPGIRWLGIGIIAVGTALIGLS